MENERPGRENAGKLQKNLRLLICYDGSRYHGWEAKPETQMTIEGKLESVLSRMVDEPVKVIGAGRTDAGVHALGMVANVRLATELSESKVREYVNHYLPEDICVREVKQVSDRFHSRYLAAGKTYRYTCYVGSLKPVFLRKYVQVLEEKPDIGKMREAASYLVGTHDFMSFCGNPQMKKSTVRTIERIEIEQRDVFLTILVKGNGFLRYMVRILTGTLLEAGYGMRKPEEMREILNARERAKAGYLMPPHGLCLMKVYY